jgi:hypothetical protein
MKKNKKGLVNKLMNFINFKKLKWKRRWRRIRIKKEEK